MDCKWIQDWLYSYLEIDIDPYDFNHYLRTWIEQEEIRIKFDGDLEDLTVDELTKRQLKAFTAWLKDSGAAGDYMQNDPFDAPAYLTLHAQEKLGKGSWCVHFTRESFESRFDRGTSLRGLHLAVWRTNKEFVDCSRNLDEERVGSAEVIFGFAFPIERLRRNISSGIRKYGKHIVLFQCDCAVVAYHDGDEEYQAIFPICSEYNVISVYITEDGALAVQTEVASEVIEFDSLEAIIEYAENDSTLPPDRRLERMAP